MVEIKSYFDNHYIVVSNGIPYIIKYYLEPEAINVFTGRWQIHRPWKKYDGQIPKTCKTLDEFKSNIKNYIDSNEQKLEEEYTNIKKEVNHLVSIGMTDNLSIYNVVPTDKC